MPRDPGSEIEAMRDKIISVQPRLIPASIVNWGTEIPQTRHRLPIDEEISSLLKRNTRPIIRSHAYIKNEFPELIYEGPYRQIRYYMYIFVLITVRVNNSYYPRDNSNAKAIVEL